MSKTLSQTKDAQRARARRERIKAAKTAKQQIEAVVQDARENGAEPVVEIPTAQQDAADPPREAPGRLVRTRKPSRHPRIRVQGHRLTLAYDRKTKTMAMICQCGHNAACKNREDARDAYTEHLQKVTA
jgi:hypothetical protein